MTTVTGKTAQRVLKSADFDLPPYPAIYQALQEKLGVDLGAVVHTLRSIPLGQTGAEHAAQRADMARFIAEQRPAAIKALPEIVATCFAPMCRPGTIDLVTAVIVPFVDRLMSVYVGIDLGLGPDSLVSQVFSRKMGVARRRKMNAELVALKARLDRAFPQDPALRRATRLSMVVLGRDTLIGALGHSLRTFLVPGGHGLTMNVAQSSVQVVHRQAIVNTHHGEGPVASGEIVYCQLQNGDPDMDRALFFGAGVHACLGRAMTGDVFQVVEQHLAAQIVDRALVAWNLRAGDSFSVYDEMIVKVGP